MPWSTTYLEDSQVVETIYSGRLTGEELREAAGATLTLAGKHQSTRLLADCRDLEGGHSVFDLYELAQLLDSQGWERNQREAILLPQRQEMVADVAFWKTTAGNRGYQIEIFTDRDKALQWLTKPRP